MVIVGSPILDHPGLPQIERLLAGGTPPPMAADLLVSLGVSDMERTARSLQSLALHPSFPRGDTKFLADFLEALGDTFEPERALTNLERVLESRENPDTLLSALRRSSERRAIVLTLSGGSQFLSDTVLRHPEYLDWILRPSTFRNERSKEKMFAELWRWIRASRDLPGGPADALRRFRQREYLRIGIRDLMRVAKMEDTTLALSNLADATLEASFRIARKELESQFGKPRWRGPDGRRHPCGFAIIAMGKLGGQELNFSSDIDLIFIYSSDEGRTTGVRDPSGGNRKARISNHDFNTRLARRIIALMTENTAEGHVFRVDTRLRPEGSQGALAYSLRSCEVYSESWGETWERQALIKARLSAGSSDLGQKFQEMIRPFIYRRTLDLSAIDEIGRIKNRINSKLAASGRRGLNVKLGEGGIREIEFIIQSFQLIYGGREPLLRTPNSLQALSSIATAGFLGIDTCKELSEAYTFLRDVEHRVQVTHGLQTHELPTDPHGLTVLARKMGFQAGGKLNERDAFEETLTRHQELVAGIFEDLFRKGDDIRPQAPETEDTDRSQPVAAETLDDSLSPADLAPYNFADPAAASVHLRLLRNGEALSHVSARAKRMFDDLLPRFLYITLDIPDPDRAVANLYRFVEKGGGREAVFSLMCETEILFEALLRLFGSSDYLSHILIQQPGLLDTFVQPGVLTSSKPKEALVLEISSTCRTTSSASNRFSNLAEAKRSEELIIGMRSLLREADIFETLTELTNLADAVLTVGLSIAEDELHSLYGIPAAEESGEEAGFAVIGLGKLGSGEINFGSDLDLVFVYSGAGETSGRFNGKPSAYKAISNHEFFFKLATRLRDGIAGPETGERAYELDLRLRPEGQKGGLVAPLERFHQYFETRAETWERQALCRARVISGSSQVGAAFMKLVTEFVYERAVSDNLAEEIDHMRRRLERELAREAEGNVDIKLGLGGIADIDFIVQYMQIIHGAKTMSVRRPDIVGALKALREANHLPEEDESALLDAYRFLRLVENRLRIATAHPIHTFPKSPEGLEMLARRIGYVDDEEGSCRAKLLSDYESQTHRVREIYQKIISGAAKTGNKSKASTKPASR